MLSFAEFLAETDWSEKHFHAAIASASRHHEKYENSVNYDKPEKQQNKLYEPYLKARKKAEMIGRILGPEFERQAKKLP